MNRVMFFSESNSTHESEMSYSLNLCFGFLIKKSCNAEDNLEYLDCGIYGTGFVSCLNDAMNPNAHSVRGHYPYKLCKDPEHA